MHFNDAERFFRFFERFPSSAQLDLEKLDPKDASELTRKYNFLRNLVFRDVANKTYESGLSLERKYGYDSDFNLMVKDGEMNIKSWIEDTVRKVDGVSLADLLTEKKSLSRENPVGVLGYFLSSLDATDMSQEEDAVDPLSLEPVMDFTDVELKKTQQEFPEAASYVTVANELHDTLLEAFRRSTNILLDPEHPKFADLKKMTEKFLANGTVSQKEKLNWILLQTFSERGSRLVYRTLKENIKQDKEKEFYAPLTEIIKDGYEGLTIADLLDAERLPDTQKTEEVCGRLIALKKKLLVTHPSLEFSPQIEMDSEDRLPFFVKKLNIQIEARHSQPYVEVEYVLPLDGEEKSLSLWIYGNDVDWNLLEDPAENSSFFTVLAEHASDVLSSLDRQSGYTRKTEERQKVQKEHFRDPVYDLRKQSRVQNLSVNENNGAEKESKLQNRKPILLKEEFLQELPESTALHVKKAVEKYDSGLLSLKKLVEYRGKVVDSMWILRQGKMRIILENTPDGLVPLEAGLREDIYRKIQAAGRQRG